MHRVILILISLVSSPLRAQEPSRAAMLLQNAHSQVGKTLLYDPAYAALAFPGGDVPIERGVCSDVIVRAYRAIGVDLQVLVNKDMHAAFDAYPKVWGLSRPDPNIDHRRVLNLAMFFTRHGKVLAVSKEARDYKGGDIVTWRLPDGRPHIGLVSSRQDGGRPRIVHNIGAGTQVEDISFAFEITGHYRFQLDAN